jgi:GT2 family glycosyltransferase
VISIIIATVNRAPLLPELLRTLAASVAASGLAAEVLVVNNGSTDDTDAVIAALGRELPALELRLIQEPTGGLSYARNAGMRAARGEILCFLDDDTVISEPWLAEMAAAFTLGPNVGAVAGRVLLQFPASGTPNWIDPAYFSLYSMYDRGGTPGVLEGEDVSFFGCNFALSRRVIEAVGLFDTAMGRKHGTLLSGEDTEYSHRIVRAGFQMAYAARAVIQHKVAPERLTPRWLARRYFWQGVTSAVHPDNRYALYPLRWLPKLLSNTLLLPVGLLGGRKRLYRTWFRLCNAAGPFYAWFLPRE